MAVLCRGGFHIRPSRGHIECPPTGSIQGCCEIVGANCVRPRAFKERPYGYIPRDYVGGGVYDAP